MFWPFKNVFITFRCHWQQHAFCYSNYETYHIFLCLFICTIYMRKQWKPICPTEWSTLFTKTTAAQSSLVM